MFSAAALITTVGAGWPGLEPPDPLDANHISAYFYVAGSRLTDLLPAEIVADRQLASL
jgi:hypothetical protein